MTNWLVVFATALLSPRLDVELSARAIVERAAERMGGREAIMAVRSRRTEYGLTQAGAVGQEEWPGAVSPVGRTSPVVEHWDWGRARYRMNRR